MKKIIKYFSFLLIVLSILTIKVNATSKSIYVNLDTLEYSLDKSNYTSIEDLFLTYNNHL